MEKDSNNAKNKKLKCLKVYDQLYELIQNGTYPPGSQLPSETILAKQMNVSRMTLRKTLSFLWEDGLIKNVQGVGHFVIDQTKKISNDMEKKVLLHPVYSYCTEKLDSVEMNFHIEPPRKSMTDSLQQYTAAVVAVDRWYKAKDVPLAYSLSFIPIELIGKKQIDLNHKEQLLNYLESQCYQETEHCHRLCSYSDAGNFTAATYKLSNEDSFLLVQETIYDSDENILISNKHYIPFNLFKIEIHF